MQKHHGSTVMILGLVAAVAIGTLHLLQSRYPYQAIEVTVERTGIADVEEVFGASAKAPAPAADASSASTYASEGYAYDDSSNSAAEQSAAALEGYEDTSSDGYGANDYGSSDDSNDSVGAGDYAIEDGPYADYAADDSSSDPYSADADPYDGSVAPAADSYASSDEDRYSSDNELAYAEDDSRYDDFDAAEEPAAAAPAPKQQAAAKPAPKAESKPIQRTANPDARDYGYTDSAAGTKASSSSSASNRSSANATTTAAAAPKRSHVEPIPRPSGDTPPNADAVYQWWPDARRVPTGQFTLIYAGQPQNRQAIALLFSRVPDPAAAARNIRVLDANGEPVSGSWSPAANPRMIQLGGIKRGRYTIIINQGMTDSTQRAMAQTLSGPVYVN